MRLFAPPSDLLPAAEPPAPQETVFDVQLQEAISAVLYPEPASEPVATPPAVAPVESLDHIDYRATPGSPLAIPSLPDIPAFEENPVWKSSAPETFFDAPSNPGYGGLDIPPPQIAQCISIPGLDDQPRYINIIPRQSARGLPKGEPSLWMEACRARVERM